MYRGGFMVSSSQNFDLFFFSERSTACLSLISSRENSTGRKVTSYGFTEGWNRQKDPKRKTLICFKTNKLKMYYIQAIVWFIGFKTDQG